MNQIRKTIIPFLSIFVMFVSCEEKVVNKYTEDDYLYFYRGRYGYTGEGQYDSLVYSFDRKESSRMRDTVWLDIRLMGMEVAEDREISVIQTNIGKDDAAVAGTHFVALDDREVSGSLVLPKHASAVKIPFIILRDVSMRTHEFRLELSLQPNSRFGIGLEDQRTFLLKLSDMTAKPENWAKWQTYFGDWGPVKMKFIIDYVGFTDFEKYAELQMDMLYYLKMKAHQKLEEYNENNHTILTEDDQVTKVTFPK